MSQTKIRKGLALESWRGKEVFSVLPAGGRVHSSHVEGIPSQGVLTRCTGL